MRITISLSWTNPPTSGRVGHDVLYVLHDAAGAYVLSSLPPTPRQHASGEQGKRGAAFVVTVAYRYEASFAQAGFAMRSEEFAGYAPMSNIPLLGRCCCRWAITNRGSLAHKPAPRMGTRRKRTPLRAHRRSSTPPQLIGLLDHRLQAMSSPMQFIADAVLATDVPARASIWRARHWRLVNTLNHP